MAWNDAKQKQGHKNPFFLVNELPDRMRKLFLNEIMGTMNPRRRIEVEKVHNNPLLDALEVVTRASGQVLDSQICSVLRHRNSEDDPIQILLGLGTLNLRKVKLEGTWWRRDGGPLLGFYGAKRHPIALLPRPNGDYQIIDPAEPKPRPVNRRAAQAMAADALAFYRPLPARALGLLDVLKFVAHDLPLSLYQIAGLSLLISCLAMLVPIGTGLVFDRLIPGGNPNQIYLFLMAFIAFALASTLFTILRGYALVRLQGKVTGGLQAAVWDRIMRLPVAFFRQFSTGDLVLRAMAIEDISRLMTSSVISLLFSSLFSLIYLFVLFFYSLPLTFLALLLCVFGMVPLFTALYKMKLVRRSYELGGQSSGFLVQLLQGLGKIRVAGAESRSLAAWSRVFHRKQQTDYKIGEIDVAVSVWNIGLSPFSTLVLYTGAFFLASAGNGLSVGNFIAFTVAYSLFFHGLVSLLNTGFSLLALIPLYERAKPILNTAVDVEKRDRVLRDIKGHISIRNLCFRYELNENLVLNDISFDVKPGEFVAIVGPSGSGKSTLFRLLLGFERATSGSITFDGHNLDQVHMPSLRQQLGVVLQDSKLLPGTIAENILGSRCLPMRSVLQAASWAGLAPDLAKMPMGMYTFVAEGSASLSGGQAQRLMIARALVHRPRVLLFDEATSALDNRTQAEIARNLSELRVTRIVIAHRLSTIAGADHILVVDKGRLVQKGTYQTLVAREGLFRELVKKDRI